MERKSSVNVQQSGKGFNVTYLQYIGRPLFSYQAGPCRSENFCFLAFSISKSSVRIHLLFDVQTRIET